MTKMRPRSIKSIVLLILVLLPVVFGSPGYYSASAADIAVKKTDLVPVTDYSKDFAIEMKYATCDNFVNKAMYPSPTCVLTKGTLDKLIKANELVGKQGYSIKIWDAYRPLSVQKIMWDATPDKNYVANPYRSGSKHNRGAAVDITLVDKNGKELQMPTGFDNFTSRASPNSKSMTTQQRKNMTMLAKAMTASGFKQLSTEWWHFDDTDYASYKIQDVPLSKFDKTDYTLSNDTISGLKSIKNSGASQLIVVTAQISNTSYAMISTYEKNNGQWVCIHKNIAGYIGVKGFSANKTEGDKKTPAGAFKVGTCFSKTSGIATGLDVYKYDSKDVWVDDPASKYYNTHQREPANGRWKSAENFSKTANGIYDVFFNIEYNTPAIKNKGSAIFFHIANPNMLLKYTNGCVSTDRTSFMSIVKWLDRDRAPVILLGSMPDIVKF